jgi:hypothetical protein
MREGVVRDHRGSVAVNRLVRGCKPGVGCGNLACGWMASTIAGVEGRQCGNVGQGVGMAGKGGGSSIGRPSSQRRSPQPGK